MNKAPRILVVALAVQLLLGGAFLYAAANDFEMFGLGGDDGLPARAAAATKVDRFDEDRAWNLLVEQVEKHGPRPAGSAASKRLSRRLHELLPGARYERFTDRFGNRLQNVVGVVPGTKPAVVIGAHYDTEALPKDHVGANDGAAGTAALVELARTMRRVKRPAGAPELRFVAFDGEEEPAGCEPFEKCGIRGSSQYVKQHRKDVRAMILLDYIAEKGTRIPREANSDIEMWSRLRAAAKKVGASVTFPDEVGPSLIDDHFPFVEAGIPAIDLIDFDYEYRDTNEDQPDKLSKLSLNAVGETVAQYLISDFSR